MEVVEDMFRLIINQIHRTTGQSAFWLVSFLLRSRCRGTFFLLQAMRGRKYFCCRAAVIPDTFQKHLSSPPSTPIQHLDSSLKLLWLLMIISFSLRPDRLKGCEAPALNGDSAQIFLGS